MHSVKKDWKVLFPLRTKCIIFPHCSSDCAPNWKNHFSCGSPIYWAL